MGALLDIDDQDICYSPEDREKLRRIWQKCLEVLKPRPELTPAEWASENIKLPAGNPITGYVDFNNAPYQVEPLNCYARDDVYKMTLKFGAQVGKTFIINAGIGYCIEYDPQNQIMMQPTETDIQVWLETKFKPMVASSDELKLRVAKPRSREGVNNNRMISYPGGFLMFSWAGSDNTVHGRSAPKTNADEVDRYEPLEGQGHPCDLLEQRSRTFGETAMMIESSTPTVKGASRIEMSYNAGDQRRWYVPCHACGHKQYFRFEQVKWDKDADDKHLPETARYECEACGASWNDRQKKQANLEGEWIAERPFNGHVSYHLPELASNFVTWRDIVRSFLDKKRTGNIQTFINVSLAEAYEETGKRADPNVIIKRAIPFAHDVPEEVLILTVGVDVQHDRIEAELVGWTGENRQSYSLDYKRFYGDVFLPESHEDSPWKQLSAFLKTEYTHASGLKMSIKCAVIDSGDGNTTDEVYAFCRLRRVQGVYASKGRSVWNKEIVAESRAEFSKAKRIRKRKITLPLLIIAVNEAKLRIMRDLYVDDPKQAGYCYFPEGRDEDYFKMLTAEQLMTKWSKGFPMRYWVPIRERNEALDCRVYALAALIYLKPNYVRIRQELASEKAKLMKTVSGETENTAQGQQKSNSTGKKRRRKMIIKDGKKEVV